MPEPRLQAPSPPTIAASTTITKTAILQRLRQLQPEVLSLQAMASSLNGEGVPTLSGKGRWQKGTIGNLLAQGNESS